MEEFIRISSPNTLKSAREGIQLCDLNNELEKLYEIGLYEIHYPMNQNEVKQYFEDGEIFLD